MVLPVAAVPVAAAAGKFALGKAGTAARAASKFARFARRSKKSAANTAANATGKLTEGVAARAQKGASSLGEGLSNMANGLINSDALGAMNPYAAWGGGYPGGPMMYPPPMDQPYPPAMGHMQPYPPTMYSPVGAMYPGGTPASPSVDRTAEAPPPIPEDADTNELDDPPPETSDSDTPRRPPPSATTGTGAPETKRKKSEKSKKSKKSKKSSSKKKEQKRKTHNKTMYKRLDDDVRSIRLLDEDDLEDLGVDREQGACEAYVLNVPKQDDYEEYDDDVRGVLNAVRRGKDVANDDRHRTGLATAIDMGLVRCAEEDEDGVGPSRRRIADDRGFDANKLFRTYVNERTPWALQKTVIPIWPSDIVRNLKRWFVFWLLWWAFGIKKLLGKSLSNTLRRFLVYALLFRTYTRRLAKDAES